MHTKHGVTTMSDKARCHYNVRQSTVSLQCQTKHDVTIMSKHGVTTMHTKHSVTTMHTKHGVTTMHTNSLQLHEHKAKGKDKVLPLHTKKVYRESRGIAPLFLPLCTKWSNSHPGCFTSRYPTGGWAGPTVCINILDNRKIPCPARNWSPIEVQFIQSTA